jgi:hypothetical protein
LAYGHVSAVAFALAPAILKILIVNEDMRSAESLKHTLRDLIGSFRNANECKQAFYGSHGVVRSACNKGGDFFD